ncbi:UNVERIFIED_ORG: integrase [Buttiauxella agrestis ATCC 33320]
MSLHPVALNVPAQPGGSPDYGRAIALRRMALHYTELPKYLLAPEVAALLHYLPDWTQHGLVNTLWNTGARINEALALRRRDFRLNDAIPHRTAPPGSGEPVVLSDADYVREMRNLFASTREKFETDALTGGKRAMPVWSVTDRTVRNWLKGAVNEASRDGVTFTVEISPHTLRHSFAMHLLYGHTPPKVLQSMMGHEKYESTEVYTKVFALDVAASQNVTFTLPVAEALLLLREKR